MKISVILGHPNPRSFNHAIARTVVAELQSRGHEVFFHDLQTERFDPLLPTEEIPLKAVLPNVVAGHCEELAQSDGVVIVHPNWWGQPPAIMKGWIDRVIRPGVAYRFVEGDNGEGIPVGLLKAKTAIVLNTSNTPKEREDSVFGDPLEAIWKKCIFNLCGVRDVRREMFRVVVTSTQEQRLRWLSEARAMVAAAF